MSAPLVRDATTFECGTGGPLDVARMSLDQLTSLYNISFMAIHSGVDIGTEGGDAYTRACIAHQSLQGALGQLCDGYQSHVEGLVAQALEEPASDLRQFGVRLLQGLHIRIPERDDGPSDGTAEVALWARFLNDTNHEVVMTATEGLDEVVDRLERATHAHGRVRTLRPELEPVREALTGLLYRHIGIVQ